MKNFIRTITTAFTLICGLSAAAITANAATVDDCAEVARSYGVSESIIQSAYNAYYADPDAYSSEDFDMVINTLHLYGTDSDMLIKEYFGIADEPDSSGNSGNSSTAAEPVQDTTESPVISTDTPAGAVTEPPTNKNNNDTEYVPPISSSDFINMTIDDKVNFVNSLPAEERNTFIENLSTEEKNSIIKQLPIDDKTQLLERFAEAGGQMGLNITVDDITDDSVSMSVRNNDGTIVDQSSIGIIVEDTGYDYRLLFSLSASIILASAAGIYLIFRKISKDDKNNEE